MLCHGAKRGLKQEWNPGMLPWVAQVGQGRDGREEQLGWVLGKSDFLAFTSENELLKRLRRSWSNSF